MNRIDNAPLQKSCAQVTAFLQKQGRDYDVIGNLVDVGYGNPDIGVTDVCQAP